MTREEAIEELKKLADLDDPEEAHIRADLILLELLNDYEVAKAYGAIGKWYA